MASQIQKTDANVDKRHDFFICNGEPKKNQNLKSLEMEGEVRNEMGSIPLKSKLNERLQINAENKTKEEKQNSAKRHTRAHLCIGEW